MARGWRKTPEEQRRAVGAWLRATRQTLGLSHAALERTSGVNRGSLHQAEAGKRDLPKPRAVLAALMRASMHVETAIDVDRFRDLVGIEGPLEDTPPAIAHGRTRPRTRRDIDGAHEVASDECTSDGGDLLPGPRSDWRYFMQEGDRFAARIDHTRALLEYELAERNTDLPDVQALALARQAACLGELNDFAQADIRARASLAKLLALGLRGTERTLSSRTLESFGRTSERGLQAYATVAEVRAYMFRSTERFDAALSALGAVHEAAAALGDRRRLATAVRESGAVHVEMGSRSVDEEAACLVIKTDPYRNHRAEIRRAVDAFADARRLRPQHDWLGLFHDWKWEARALRMLGETNRSATAAAKAAELASDSPARFGVSLLRGRWELAQRHDQQAEDLLLQALHLGRQVHSSIAVAGALVDLAQLYSLHAGSREAAINCAVASLVAWPYHLEARDSQRSVRLLRRLEASMRDIDHRLERNTPPFNLVTTLPIYSNDRLQRVRGHLWNDRVKEFAIR